MNLKLPFNLWLWQVNHLQTMEDLQLIDNYKRWGGSKLYQASPLEESLPNEILDVIDKGKDPSRSVKGVFLCKEDNKDLTRLGSLDEWS